MSDGGKTPMSAEPHPDPGHPALKRVVFQRPGFADPRIEVLVVEIDPAKDQFRVFDKRPPTMDGPPIEAVSHKFTIEQGVQLAERAVAGDPALWGDPRALLLVAAALVALCGTRPNGTRWVNIDLKAQAPATLDELGGGV